MLLLDNNDDLNEIKNLLTNARDIAKTIWPEPDQWSTTPCTCSPCPPDFHISGFDSHWDHCDKSHAKRDWKFHVQQLLKEIE